MKQGRVKQMIKENLPEFEKSNIHVWQKDNLGEGTHIVVLDDGYETFLYTHPTTVVMSFDEIDETPDTEHGAIISAVGYEIAPKTRVTYIPFMDLSYEGKTKALKWIMANEDDIDVVTMSLNYTSNMAKTRELWDIIKNIKIPFFVASGNDGDDEVGFPACLPCTISVGAFNDFGDSVWRKTNYGEALDILGYHNIYYLNSRGVPVVQIGTSIGTPWVAYATLLYISWRKRNGLPKLTRDMWKKWEVIHVRDIEAEGWDVKSGLGVFRLPKEIPTIEEEDTMKFKDTNGHWADGAIDFVSDKGLLKGYEDGTFKPERAVTRAELATVLARQNGYVEKK